MIGLSLLRFLRWHLRLGFLLLLLRLLLFLLVSLGISIIPRDQVLVLDAPVGLVGNLDEPVDNLLLQPVLVPQSLQCFQYVWIHAANLLLLHTGHREKRCRVLFGERRNLTVYAIGVHRHLDPLRYFHPIRFANGQIANTITPILRFVLEGTDHGPRQGIVLE